MIAIKETKNDLEIKIRHGILTDAESLIDIQNKVIVEEDYLLLTSGELNKTIEEQREWIRKVQENPKETIIVATYKDTVVGWLVFQEQNRKRMAHVGTFVIMINKEHRGLGIGRMLIEALIDWAKENAFIEKISLGVFSTNESAIALYKSMGFLEEGRKIKQFKIRDNTYVDDVLMYMLV